MKTINLAALVLIGAVAPTLADEGMWTFNNFPSDKVEKAYGFRPDQKWLDHMRLSSVRLSVGCSGGFVSAQGLVQTNYHCSRPCLGQLSTAGHSLFATGFYAREAKDERKCPGLEIDQLVEISPVTDRINKAVAGKNGADFSKALKAEEAAITDECAGKNAAVRCDVVSLYDGGVYDLYKYRRYQDVRLVFAPEEAIGAFGGDPDNFEYPRYTLDVSYMRVYANGKPLDTSTNYFPYAKADAQPGDVTFVPGSPGSTNRLDTVAQLESQRDFELPRSIATLSELRGELTVFASESPDKRSIADSDLIRLENSLKAEKGEFAALIDPTIIKDRAASEAALRAKVDADPTLRAQDGVAWDNIKQTLDRFRPQMERFNYIAGGGAFYSTLFSRALQLVRHATEVTKPNGERLPAYTDANLPELRQSVLSPAPVHPELEKLTLTFSLTQMREALGPDDDFVKKVLGKKSPAALAAELIDGTGLADLALRTRLLAADPAAIAASSDPMIKFACRVDPDMRAVRKEQEDGYSAPMTKYSAEIARARFKIEGPSTYPDATFTPRLSYGAVKGYRAGGKDISPMTYVGGLYARATGSDPFQLPPTWIAAQSSLNPHQPMNFVTTNDSIGGNSGSPMINKNGEIVGLVFDGNIEALGGGFGYDVKVNRTVAVNVGMLRLALDKVYHAVRLVAELAH